MKPVYFTEKSKKSPSQFAFSMLFDLSAQMQGGRRHFVRKFIVKFDYISLVVLNFFVASKEKQYEK